MKSSKLYLCIILLIGIAESSQAQSRHFYHRIDIGSGNAYTFVGSNLITSFANYFAHDILFDNSFNYSVFSGEAINGAKIRTKPENLLGLTARDLLNDATAGIKLGYKSDNFGSFNWGIYGSAHYKINQYKARVDDTDEYSHERFSYFRPGIGAYLLFGSVENRTKFQIEAGAQYNIPLSYKGLIDGKKDVLNSGITTHWALKIGGAHDFSGGIFVDINHFDIFIPSVAKKMKMYTFGITLTITPRRGEKLYD